MNFDSIINGLSPMRVTANIAMNAEKSSASAAANTDVLAPDAEHFNNTRDTLELSLENLSSESSELMDIQMASAIMKITANDIITNPRDAILAQANINPDAIAKLLR